MKPETFKKFAEAHSAKYPRVRFPAIIQQLERCYAALNLIINTALLVEKTSTKWHENAAIARRLIGAVKEDMPPRVSADLDKLTARINSYMGNPKEQTQEQWQRGVLTLALLSAILFMDAANTAPRFTHAENGAMYAGWKKLYERMAETYEVICERDYDMYEDLQPLVLSIYKNHLG